MHDAFETTRCSLFSCLWLTPNTTVRSTFFPGADIRTFLAPAVICFSAFFFSVNRPVHSSATSTSSSFHGSSSGFLSLNTFIELLAIFIAEFCISIFPIRKHSSGQTYQWNRGQYNTCLSFILYYYL